MNGINVVGGDTTTTSTLFSNVFLYDATSASGMAGPSDLLVESDRIAVIGSGARARITDQTLLVDGHMRHLLVPGLINAHFHSSANHRRGSLPSLPLELFMLYESSADPRLIPTPREAYLRTMLAALEMIKSGTTAVQDDAFLMPCPTPEIVDAVMQAYADCGIRATVALDQPDLPEFEKLPYLESFTDPTVRAALKSPAPLGRTGLLEMYDYLIRSWHGAGDGRLGAAVSVSAPQRVSTEYFEALDDLSRSHSIPLFTHMLETKAQRALATEQPRFAGRSLVRYTADLGLLTERTNVIHAVWVDDADLELIAEAGAVIALNPISNLRLGSGVAPFRRMKDLGIRTALGTDEAICDDSANPWGAVKMTGLIHNISGLDSDQWPTAAEVLDSLWQGGAAAMLKSDQLGCLEEGYLADMALIDLDTLAFTPLNDLRRQLVYCESGTSVRLTMVAGRVVFGNGRVATVSEQAIIDEARAVFTEKQAAIKQANQYADLQYPQYQSMVRTAAAADLGMNRWVGNS